MNQYKIGDIVFIAPYGTEPNHYCRIQSFSFPNDLAKGLACFARGDWYSKSGNCVKGIGFDVNYIQLSTEKDLSEAIEIYNLKNSNNNLWYAAWNNFFGDSPNAKVSEFVSEFKRLTTDGKHPFDCKCIVCL